MHKKANLKYLFLLLLMPFLNACGISSISDKDICSVAMTQDRLNFIWETNERLVSYVDEAKRRNLGLGDCIRHSGRVKLVQDRPIDEAQVVSLSDRRLCSYVISKNGGLPFWKSWSPFLPYVSEAKRRGLTIDICMKHNGWTESLILK